MDHFTPDADYIVSSGVVERGREEMVAGHRLIFTTWAHGTRLAGGIDSIRFLTSDVAFVVAHGTMLLPGQEEIDPRELTVYSSSWCARARPGGSPATRTPPSRSTPPEPRCTRVGPGHGLCPGPCAIRRAQLRTEAVTSVSGEGMRTTPS